MSFSAIFRLLRPKQWVKNLFVFAPVLFAGDFLVAESAGKATLAFLYFCVASSCVYILNDLNDIAEDRAHPLKSKTRPLASGHVSPKQAIFTFSLLMVVLASGFIFIKPAMLPMLTYILMNVLYSVFARKVPVLDIFTIALGFVLRVVAGALVIAEPLSTWMFVTTMSLALYLASNKRKHELRSLGSTSRSSLKGYTAEMVERFAEISATASLVFYSIFVVTVKAELIFTIPLVAFGLFRYWFITEALEPERSPTEAMLRDWPLVAAVVAWVLACGGVLLFAGH